MKKLAGYIERARRIASPKRYKRGNEAIGREAIAPGSSRTKGDELEKRKKNILAGMVGVSGLMVFISTFLGWTYVKGSSTFPFHYTGWHYLAGNKSMPRADGFFLFQWHSHSSSSGRAGKLWFTGFWPMLLGVVIIGAAVLLWTNRKSGIALSIVAGFLGCVVAVFNMLYMIPDYYEIGPRGTGGWTDFQIGGGLWVLLVFSFIAAVLGFLFLYMERKAL